MLLHGGWRAVRAAGERDRLRAVVIAGGDAVGSPLQRATLPALMQLTAGRPEVLIGLIDGPARTDLPGFRGARFIPGGTEVAADPADPACLHATLVASILAARRDGEPSGICPGCTFLLHPIFPPGATPIATPAMLAGAIEATVRAGARVINLSLALLPGTATELDALRAALDLAGRRGAIVVAAAGNQARIGHSLITSHPAVLPVTASDPRGGPTPETNLGRSIGQRGVGAPGEHVTGLRPDGTRAVFGGTSAAAPFVTGTIALLYSLLPGLDRGRLLWALTRARHGRSRLVPAPLDAWAAYEVLTGKEARAA